MPFLERKRQSVQVRGPALGLIETSSIARGLVVADAMVKRSPVQLLLVRPISPGKHVVLVSGDVAEVDEAMRAGIEAAGTTLVDKLELSQAATLLLGALGGAFTEAREALGIIETNSVASSLQAADAACKAAAVNLAELRLADGLGGKGYFIVAGDQADVEAALHAAATSIAPELLHSRELIARPHADLLPRLKVS